MSERHRRLKVAAVATGLAALLAACDAGEDTRAGGRQPSSSQVTTTPAVTIESSLDGMRILPRRLRWIVTTSLPPERIREVRFVVDRRLVWVDDKPPYSYGEEGAYLVTSFFGVGEPNRPHRFTTRIVESTGRIWRRTVVARVPEPDVHRRAPSFGIWWRLPAAHLENPPSRVLPFERYTSHMFFLGSHALVVGKTSKRAFAYEYSADARTLRVSTRIFLGSDDVAGDLSGWLLKGYQCQSDGPPATYAWSFPRGRVPLLRLEARDEPCEPRRDILEGTWQLLD